MSTEESANNSENCNLRLKRLYELIQNPNLHDVVLISGNDQKRFSANKNLLSEASEFFNTMFTGSFREAESKEVTLKEVDGNILKKLIEYCYIGILDCDKNSCEALFIAANMLQICSAEEICSNFIPSLLNPSNCLGFQNLAQRCNNKSLMKSTTEYICSNFSEISRCEEFSHLTAEKVENLLAHDDIKILSEEDIFYALKSWVEFDSSHRKGDVANLLRSVRFSFLSPSFIVDHIEKFCESIDGCKELIQVALKNHLLPDRIVQCPAIRNYIGNLEEDSFIISFSGCGPINMEYFCPKKRNWCFLGSIPIKTHNYGIAFFDNKIFVIGGNDGKVILRTIITFDLNCLMITSTFTMIEALEFFSNIVYDEFLYVIGGISNTGCSYAVRKINVRKRIEENVFKMTCCRHLAGCAMIRNNLVITGGISSSFNSICNVEYAVRNIIPNSMLENRAGHAVVVLNDFIYAIGGKNFGIAIKTVERSDLNLSQWKYVASLNTAYDQIYATVLENRIIVVGYLYGKKMIEEYNSDEDKWTRLCESVNESQFNAGIITVPGNLLTKFKGHHF